MDTSSYILRHSKVLLTCKFSSADHLLISKMEKSSPKDSNSLIKNFFCELFILISKIDKSRNSLKDSNSLIKFFSKIIYFDI